SEVVEGRSALGGLRIHAVDGLDTQQTEILLVLFWRPHLSGDHIAGTQVKATNLRLRDIDILMTGGQALTAQEAKTIFDGGQHATAKDVALAFGLGLQQTEDEIVFAQSAVARQIQLASQIAQFCQRFGLKLNDVHNNRLGRRKEGGMPGPRGERCGGQGGTAPMLLSRVSARRLGRARRDMRYAEIAPTVVRGLGAQTV